MKSHTAYHALKLVALAVSMQRLRKFVNILFA